MAGKGKSRRVGTSCSGHGKANRLETSLFIKRIARRNYTKMREDILGHSAVDEARTFRDTMLTAEKL